MPIGSFIGAVGGLIGGAQQAKAQKKVAREQMQFSDAQSARQMAFQDQQATRSMDFQERMSSTAYQRSMADMRAAGLNPILAYQQGGAGGAPGAMGQGAAGASAGYSPPDVIGKAISSGLAVRRQNAEIKNLNEQNSMLKAQTMQAFNAGLREWQQANVYEHSAKNMAITNQILASDALRAKTDADYRQTKTHRFFRFLGNVGRDVNPFGQASNSARSLMQQ